MKMSIKNAKTMSVSRKIKIPKVKFQLDGLEVKRVSKLFHLGELINKNGRSEEEFRRSIEIARKSFNKMRTMMTNPIISLPVRLRFIKCFVWSTLPYVVETRTISKISQSRLEALET